MYSVQKDLNFTLSLSHVISGLSFWYSLRCASMKLCLPQNQLLTVMKSWTSRILDLSSCYNFDKFVVRMLSQIFLIYSSCSKQFWFRPWVLLFFFFFFLGGCHGCPSLWAFLWVWLPPFHDVGGLQYYLSALKQHWNRWQSIRIRLRNLFVFPVFCFGVAVKSLLCQWLC